MTGVYNGIQNLSSKDLLAKVGALELMKADLESRGLTDAASETEWLIKRLNSINSELNTLDAGLDNLRNVWRPLDLLHDDNAVNEANKAYVAEKNKAGLEG
ncbi:MAG: hypothetical protein K2Y22_14240 [Candidatus Obscuribacterales bacterium]|nr:hypothetical protein [Candidatus Obscuribacterales bacterium]